MSDFSLYPYEKGDLLRLKKEHPCGSKEWEVLRAGADISLKCRGCGHVLRMKRRHLEKATREVIKTNKAEGENT